MAFGTSTVARRDVEFNVNLGQFRAQLGEADAAYRRVSGSMSDEAQRLSIRQYELNKAVEKYGVESVQAARKAVALKSEMDAITRAAERNAAEVAKASAVTTEATVASERHSRALLSEERALGRFSRGALAAGGASSELKRALLLGSGSFLLGVGVLSAFKKAVDAARQQQIATAQLQVSLKNAGLSWTQYGSRVDEALNAQVRATAFTKDELTAALAANVRRFGDVNQALKANALAADVARARNISLADAQNLLQRASFGNARSARQLGIVFTASTANLEKLKETTKHATVEQVAAAKAADQHANRLGLLAAIQAKYQGSAAKNLQTSTGKQQLFNAELKLSEEIIGNALLPTIDKYISRLAVWLDKMNRSGKLQRDVNHAMHEAEQVIGGVKEVLHGLSIPLGLVNRLLGGTKHSVELLSLAFVAMKLGILPSLFTSVAASIRGVGSAAVVSAGEVNGLAAAEGRAAAGGGGVGAAGAAGAATRAAGGIGLRGAIGASALALGPLALAYAIGGTKKGDNQTQRTIYDLAQVDPARAVEFAKQHHYTLTIAQAESLRGRSFQYPLLVPNNGEKLTNTPPALFSGNPYKIADTAATGPNAFGPSAGGGKGGGGSSAGGYRPTGVQALDLAIAQAQASGSSSQIRAAAAAKLAYDEKAAAFAQGRINAGKGSPSLVQQLEQILADEGSQRGTIQSIDQAAQSKVDSAKRKAEAAAHRAAAAERKRRAAIKAAFKHHELLLKREAHQDALELAHALTHRESVLKLAVEKAKLTDSTSDDLKALDDLEAFYKRKANDPKLNRKLRDTFAAKDIAERILIKKLKQGRNTALAHDEQQFLSDITGIIGSFAPNFSGANAPGSGKLETHGYNTVFELRQQTQILKRLEANNKFPASTFGVASTAALTGFG